MSNLKQTAVRLALFLSFSAAAAAPICIKMTYSCAGTCGTSGFSVCEEGMVPGSPGKQTGSLQTIRWAKCTTYHGAADTVTGVCEAGAPPSYESTPLPCGGGAEGQCCFEKTIPDDVEQSNYKMIVEYRGSDC
jgi:hypothetical protein